MKKCHRELRIKNLNRKISSQRSMSMIKNNRRQRRTNWRKNRSSNLITTESQLLASYTGRCPTTTSCIRGSWPRSRRGCLSLSRHQCWTLVQVWVLELGVPIMFSVIKLREWQQWNPIWTCENLASFWLLISLRVRFCGWIRWRWFPQARGVNLIWLFWGMCCKRYHQLKPDSWLLKRYGRGLETEVLSFWLSLAVPKASGMCTVSESGSSRLSPVKKQTSSHPALITTNAPWQEPQTPGVTTVNWPKDTRQVCSHATSRRRTPWMKSLVTWRWRREKRHSRSSLMSFRLIPQLKNHFSGLVWSAL